MQSSDLTVSERLVYNQENNPIPHRIPCNTGVLLMHSHFVVGGSLVISAGTANGTSLGENPGNLFLQNLRIQGFAIPAGYPTGTLMNLGPRSLMRRKIFDHPEKRFVADQFNTISGINGAAGTYTLGLDFTKYWALPWMARPCDTALDSGMYGQLLATFTTGSRNAQYSGNDRTFNYAGVFVDVTHKRQLLSGNGTGPKVVLFDDERIVNINGANSRLQLNAILPPDGSCTDLLFISETTNQALADTIVNRISLVSGSELFFDQYATDLRADMEDQIGDGSTTTTPRTGLYWAQVASDGYLTNAKPNVSAVVDQSNPGTDRLIVDYRRAQAIPAAKVQSGGGKVVAAY